MPRGPQEGVELYIVRHWDGMDGVWTDCTKPVSYVEAKEEWNDRTQHGARNTSFNDIDYYDIFPANTRMIYS